MKLAFIGLGVMGYPMAGHLQCAGHDITVFNRTAAKAEQWVAQYSGASAASPAQAAIAADIAMLCVGNDDDVRSVVYGDTGVLAGLPPGALLIDHTTTSATLAQELASACEAIECDFLDAPVSGGQLGAEQGVLSIMVGGDEVQLERALPALESYGRKIARLGPVGAGQHCKMVNQVCIAGLLQGLSEGVALAQAVGLDIASVVDVLGSGAGQSWQLQNRAQTMAEGQFDFGFALDWMRKDLAICLQEAQRQGLALPAAEMVDGFYAELQQRGLGRADTSALVQLLAKPGN